MVRAAAWHLKYRILTNRGRQHYMYMYEVERTFSADLYQHDLGTTPTALYHTQNT